MTHPFCVIKAFAMDVVKKRKSVKILSWFFFWSFNREWVTKGLISNRWLGNGGLQCMVRDTMFCHFHARLMGYQEHKIFLEIAADPVFWCVQESPWTLDFDRRKWLNYQCLAYQQFQTTCHSQVQSNHRKSGRCFLWRVICSLQLCQLHRFLYFLKFIIIIYMLTWQKVHYSSSVLWVVILQLLGEPELDELLILLQ